MLMQTSASVSDISSAANGPAANATAVNILWVRLVSVYIASSAESCSNVLKLKMWDILRRIFVRIAISFPLVKEFN